MAKVIVTVREDVLNTAKTTALAELADKILAEQDRDRQFIPSQGKGLLGPRNMLITIPDAGIGEALKGALVERLQKVGGDSESVVVNPVNHAPRQKEADAVSEVSAYTIAVSKSIYERAKKDADNRRQETGR